MANAFLFVPLLAGTWIFGLYLSMLASHYFLSVLESSAAGNDRVEMPEEPFVDWVGKVVYLGFFVILWGLPSMIAIAATRGMDEATRLVVGLLPFWLCFPVGMLSPLCLQSKWVPFWPGLLQRMGERPGATLQMYLWTLPVAALFFYSFGQLTRSETSYPAVFVLGVLGAVAFLLYARLLGRYGFVLSFTRGLVNEKPAKKPRKPRPRPTQEPEPEFVQPTEMPGLRDPFNEEVTGYGVDLSKPSATPAPGLPARIGPSRPVEAPAKPAERAAIDEEDSYVMGEVEETPEPPQRGSAIVRPGERHLPTPDEEEVQMFNRNRKLTEPAAPFGGENLRFLGGADMVGGLLKLGGGLIVFSLLIHFLAALKPE